jgi:hypothetical protein
MAEQEYKPSTVIALQRLVKTYITWAFGIAVSFNFEIRAKPKKRGRLIKNMYFEKKL